MPLRAIGGHVSAPTIDQYVKIDKYHAPQWLGDRATRRFHVMAKPAGSTCNLARTGQVRLCEVGNAAGVLQTVRISDRLPGRVSEEPPAAHTGGRAGPQLSLPGAQAVLRARGSCCEEDGGAAARDAGFAAAADVRRM